MEDIGEAFGAQLSGKLKMGFQSVTILVILVYVNYRNRLDTDALRYAILLRDIAIWGTVVITVASGLMYVRKAVTLFRKHGQIQP